MRRTNSVIETGDLLLRTRLPQRAWNSHCPPNHVGISRGRAFTAKASPQDGRDGRLLFTSCSDNQRGSMGPPRWVNTDTCMTPPPPPFKHIHQFKQG